MKGIHCNFLWILKNFPEQHFYITPPDNCLSVKQISEGFLPLPPPTSLREPLQCPSWIRIIKIENYLNPAGNYMFKVRSTRIRCAVSWRGSKSFETKSFIKNLFVSSYCRSINLLTTNVPHHTETSQLNCNANQWTGFFMIGTSVTKELIKNCVVCSRGAFKTLSNM